MTSSDESPATARTEATRRKVIDAAVECILDRGFYQASSNEIARAAGVSWGVIQYHFQSRERLLLAVMDDAIAAMVATYEAADINGRSRAARLRQYFDVLETFYGQRGYLAFMQIELDLLHNPEVSTETAEALLRMRQDAAPAHEKLLAAVAPPDMRVLVFHTLRGFITSQLVERDVLGVIQPPDPSAYFESADQLIAALAAKL